VTFNAITNSAVTEAMKHPRGLDEDLIDAYKARRALDYLVGFTLSPILWRKLPGAKSAGRVQSVALRLIVDREREIESSSPGILVGQRDVRGDGQSFTARLVQLDGNEDRAPDHRQPGDADAPRRGRGRALHRLVGRDQAILAQPAAAVHDLHPAAGSGAQARVRGEPHDARRSIALRRRAHHLHAHRRVDMAPEAVSAARRAIANRYDSGYVPDRPRQYQSKIKNAQEAHEAIRPTDFDRSHAASGDHARLYELVYNRALASQMASARLERTTVDLIDGAGRAVLRASGQVVLFPGFMALLRRRAATRCRGRGSARMPASRGRRSGQDGVEATQIFTQPPPRYSEASLVKRLRSSDRRRRPMLDPADAQGPRICPRRQGPLRPEESGAVTAFLERFFALRQLRLHAELERELDDVSGGRLDWQKLLDDFWRDFKPKAGEVMDQKPSEITAALDEFLAPWLYPPRADGSDPRVCPQCGNGRLSLRGGKFGAFVACSNYPDCKYTQKFGQGGDQAQSEGPADLGDGITLKTGRFGPYVERGEARTPNAPRSQRTFPLEGCHSEVGRTVAVVAARDRGPSRDRQADHGLDRALRPLSRPRRQICQVELDRRSVRNRDERGRS
jgi:DNA topoisomerase-1